MHLHSLRLARYPIYSLVAWRAVRTDSIFVLPPFLVWWQRSRRSNKFHRIPPALSRIQMTEELIAMDVGRRRYVSERLPISFLFVLRCFLFVLRYIFLQRIILTTSFPANRQFKRMSGTRFSDVVSTSILELVALVFVPT